MLHRIETTACIRGRAVRDVIASPSGRHLFAVHGEARHFRSPSVWGGALWSRGEGEAVVVPLTSPRVLVMDDGGVVVCDAEVHEIALTRFGARGSDVVQSRWRVTTGASLQLHACVLLDGGRTAILGGEDRDDGHGWTEPVYRDWWRIADLDRGSVAVPVSTPASTSRVLRAPGSPTLSAHAGGGGLAAVLPALWFRREWPRCVGARYLLTSARLHELSSGRPILGAADEAKIAEHVFFDLSSDERFAVSVGPTGTIEVWDVEGGSVVAREVIVGEARCATFVGAREVAVGTASGEVVVLGLDGS